MEQAADIASLGYFWAIVLGLVQGVAEFLPISSSGHLALVEHLGLGRTVPIAFDVFLHFATLLAIILYFRKSIAWYWRNDRLALWYVIAATIPTGIIGLLCKRYFEALRVSPTMVCIGLLVTASGLSVSEIRRGAAYQLRDLGWFGAGVIGLCQALALAPGISRSGATISGAMICGVDRGEAFRFSFILSIPAVLGAVCLSALEMVRHGGTQALLGVVGSGSFWAGFVVAALAGYATLNLLDRLVEGGKLVWFAGYCCLVAIAGLVYFNFVV